MLRRLLAASLLVLLLNAPASADDLFEIDERLVDAGFEDAYTESLPGEDGARILVDFASESTSRAAYEQEAARAAELVWLHLEEQVQTVDVAPTAGVVWLGDDLPPAVSFTRDDLTDRYGTRSAALDQPSEFSQEDFYLGGFGVLLLGLLLVGLLVVSGLVVAVVVLARRSAPLVVPFGYGPAYRGDPAPVPPPPAAPPPVPPGTWQPPSA